MRKIKGLRWYMIALVTLGTVLGYLTRNTVAAAAPTLMEELHISTQQYSYIIAPILLLTLSCTRSRLRTGCSRYEGGLRHVRRSVGRILRRNRTGWKLGRPALARGAVGAAEAAMIPAA